MNTVNKRIESIFAQAAALQQSGRLRNTIYCMGRKVYILNQDHTILIQFALRESETPFQTPISFNANDYDSNRFVEKDGKICFVQQSGDFVREKSCQVPNLSVKEVQRIFQARMEAATWANKVVLDKTFTTCLDESLSHVEFKGVEGQLIALQRNIYTGSIIKVSKQASTKKGLVSFSGALKDFRTIGLRTDDFLALFTFAPSLTFYFAGKDTVPFENLDQKLPFTGLVSRCIYDEMGVNHGR